MTGRPRQRAPGELAALVRRVNAVYETGAAPARSTTRTRAALTAQQRHSLTLAVLDDPASPPLKSYAALLVECRIDTARELRALLRVVASNAVATVLHWALATPGDDGRPRWSADHVLAVANGKVPSRAAVPSGELRGLAGIDPSVCELAAGVAPPGDPSPTPPRHDDLDELLRAVEEVYARRPSGEAGRHWQTDELHALVLAELDDAERERSHVTYLELLVTWGLDTPEGLRDLLRLQAAGAVRTTLLWLRHDGDHDWPDGQPVLAEAAVRAWWAGPDVTSPG